MQSHVEGKANVYVQKGVFLNPRMSRLRDVSVLFLKNAADKDSTLLDSTAATGIRAIRYAKEAGIKKAVLLDINSRAARNARLNIKANKLKFEVRNESIQSYCSTAEERFNIIDLDPFGSPAPNIHDLMKVTTDGGILMVTATDTAVLCGAHDAACIKTYHAKPLHNLLCKEAGTRILISYIARAAAQFNYGIEVKLAISELHYMRVFIKLKAGAKEAVESVKRTGFCSYCGKCAGFTCTPGVAPILERNCKYCGNQVERSGPMWLSELYDKELIKKMQKDAESHPDGLLAKLELLGKELDIPMFYSVPNMTRLMGIGSVSPNAVMKKLGVMGYRTSATQFEKDCIKTDADPRAVSRAIASVKPSK